MKHLSYYLLILYSFFLITHCAPRKSTEHSGAEHYTMGDFDKVKKIDIHVHVNTKGTTVIDMARANNFQLLNIAVSFSDKRSLANQLEVRNYHLDNSPEIMQYSTAFSLDNWDHEDWADQVIAGLKTDFDNGALGVKIWKNIGMEYRDENGALILLSDPKFDAVFNFIEEQGKVLLSHAGEPKNCWLPLDSMTVKNDYNYFKANPKYHMYLHPEMPSYEDQIRHRDNMLAKHPNIPFVAVHMASLEWSVDRLSAFLERFPNASVDLAERISHTQYQSQQDRKKVRDFFIRYQDRILYATDFQQGNKSDPEELKKYMMDTWLNDWKYFNTNEMVTVPQLDEPVQGLALPKSVVDKIYFKNAVKIFPVFSKYQLGNSL